MLRLKKIVKNYFVNKELTVNALKGISLDFRKNEFVSILGPSGCGKTTLLNIIGGLDKYTKGDLEIDGVSTRNFKEGDWNAYRNQRIGFVFQSYNLIPHQTILENVALALTIAGLSASERREKAKKALTEVGLEKEIHKRPNQLSGGQMQRVAIARALVNDPQILLADEPTGALDSKTSVQILDLLKKVAENYLVIMVTHNSTLAEQYSTRIITLLDGVVTSDSMPFDADAGEKLVPNEQKPKIKKKVKMNFLTALKLSLKNLLTKKGRTISTSFAGSIGIIGVALVLALSNGFNIYIAKLQSDTLSGYPVTVSTFTTDLNALYEQTIRGMTTGTQRFPENDNNIHVYNPQSVYSQMSINNITDSYLEYIDDYHQQQMALSEDRRQIIDISYSYAKTLNIFTGERGSYKMVSISSSSNPLTLLGSSSVFQEALGNTDFVREQYDVLYGKYPENKNQVALIVDSRNRLSISTLNALSIPYQTEQVEEDDGDITVSYTDIPFSELVNQENPKMFHMIFNDDYYVEDGSNFRTLNSRYSGTELQNRFAGLIDNQKTEDLEVVGVLRVNKNSALELYGSGILYLPELTEVFVERSLTSKITQAQIAAKDEGMAFHGSSTLTKKTLADIKVALFQSANSMANAPDEILYNYLWQLTGSTKTPSAIFFYPKDFASKQLLTQHLDAFNDLPTTAETDRVFYTDAAAVLSSSMGQMIDIISYVLIAFASISLVVSSVMIGIITYVSVIERTKEIGVLRSLGASKNDVSSVFNAETIIIGFVAGLLGVLITYLLCIPINAILISVAGGTISTNLAVLNPLVSLVLIGISCLLTLIGGAIPSRFAAKLDPVKALRSE